MKNLLLLIGLLLTFSGVNSESPPVEPCDILYEAAISARDNMLRNPVVAEMLGGDIDYWRRVVKDLLGISSIDSDDEIYEVSCAIADSRTMAELAAKFNLTENQIRGDLEHLNIVHDQLKSTFEGYKIECRKVHRWVKRSGFPDDWLLTTSVADTKKLLNSVGSDSRNFIRLYGGWGKDNAEVARILTESSSLKEYLKGMGDLDSLLNDKELLNTRLGPARVLHKKKKMLSLFAAMDSYINLLGAGVSIGIHALP